MPPPALLPPGTPDEVVERARRAPRVPVFDPRVGRGPVAASGGSEQRIVVVGDSLSHGFQSGAIYNTAQSYPALIARALGWSEYFRHPVYDGPGGGLPINIEFLLRDLERRYGKAVDAWEIPGALLHVRAWMDTVEDYWERGAGSVAPDVEAINHALAVYGWDLDDAVTRTAVSLAASIKPPRDDLTDQLVSNHSARAALRVYPHWSAATRAMTLVEAARGLGEDGGIETLVVFLGANNALGTVTDLKVVWSGGTETPTVFAPADFRAGLATLAEQVRRVAARHVIWVTVPHVTIAPIARGIGGKVAPGSRYFPYYSRPWVADDDFDPDDDPHITAADARAVDTAIDLYNEAITELVGGARDGGRDWYLFDIAGVLDRLASRRYIDDPAARPPWWTPYPFPPPLAALRPEIDSRFLAADGRGGRAAGGLFSLDGVHPTTIAYGLIAQELIGIMRLAGVAVQDVDFAWLLRQDTLVTAPPQNLGPGLKTIGWADQHLGWITRVF
jgi:hypothetical protein